MTADHALRWTTAIRSLAEAGEDAGAQANAYLDCIDAGSTTLRQHGATGLEALLAGDPSLRARLGPARVPRALEPEAASEARRISARIAALHPPSAARLCAALVRSENPLDPGVTEAALTGCGWARAEEGVALLERAARDREPLVPCCGGPRPSDHARVRP